LTGRKKRLEGGAVGKMKAGYHLQNFLLLGWVAGLIFVTHFSFWRRLTESQANSEYQRLFKDRKG